MSYLLPSVDQSNERSKRLRESQSAGAVMMIRPCRFGSNPLTVASNAFQQSLSGDMQHAAAAEFEALVAALRQAGVTVHDFDDTPEPHTPDAVFPNNWVSFHADGTVVLYPMLAENRRTERRPDLIERLQAEQGYQVSRILDLSGHERRGRFLEGTGSLVLDRVQRIAYACLSPRTDTGVLQEFIEEMGYRAFVFDAVDATGLAVYHTNVMMAVGSRFAVACLDSVRHAEQRAGLTASLTSGGRALIDIDTATMASFAGNMLEVADGEGRPVIVMSGQARASLNDHQLDQLGRCGRIVSADIPVIEAASGGSVRCMLAEVHLPRAPHRAPQRLRP